MKLIDVLSEIILNETKLKVVEGVDYVKVPSWSNDIEIIIPLTHNGSRKYGIYTSWCTSVNNPAEFYSYSKIGILVYFIMKNEIVDWKTKSGEMIKTANKYAWFISFNGKNGSWWNINDDNINQPFELPRETIDFISDFLNKNIKFKIMQKLINGIELNDDEVNYDDDLDLKMTQIKSLGNLKSVSGDLDLEFSMIESLGNLESVGGYLELEGTPIESLGSLKTVGFWLNLNNTPIKSLGNLESVGRWLDLNNTPIKSLGNLKSVGTSLHLSGVQIESLDNLQSVGVSLDLQNTPIKDLGKLKYVGKNVMIKNTKLTPEDFKNIKIGGKIIVD